MDSTSISYGYQKEELKDEYVECNEYVKDCE